MTAPTLVPPTVLDPGRVRPAEAEVTDLDPGRVRPNMGGPAFDGTLPPQLATRFVVNRVLNRSGGEADVLLVEERSSGENGVLKLYRTAGRDPVVQDFLLRKRIPRTVTVFEAGTEEGRDYELMEYVTGGSLAEFDQATASDTAVLTEVVQQVTEALAAMHFDGVVHRDVKPANVLVRRRSELDVALADFGISSYRADPDPASVDDESGTLRYMPPEFILGRLLSPAYDWWSLGATVLELATGSAIMADASTNEVRLYVGGGQIDLRQVVDDRIRLLCQGLLTRDFELRWGADEVGRWLLGESPPVPEYEYDPRGGGPVEDAVADAYTFADVAYHSRIQLAAAMTANWETSVALLYGGGPEPLARLETWLLQYGPQESDDAHRNDPPNLRLLRLLRRMSPTHPPIYRQHNICVPQLPNIARDALLGNGNWPEIVYELWTSDALLLLSEGSAAPELGGGDGLDSVDRRWRDRWQRWRELIRSLPDEGARDRLDMRDPELLRTAVATCLAATVAGNEGHDELRRKIMARDRSLRLPWFSQLVSDPDGMWISRLLTNYADHVAAERDERERAEAARLRHVARNRRFSEWSRRRNRPLALSWAVAGVFVLAMLCTLMIGVSDIAGEVSTNTIVSAWLATVLAIATALTFEAVLAWEIGGRFHPRYSILGGGFAALSRAARTIQGRGIALGVVVGVLGGAYLLTTFLPMATPLVLGAAVIVWAVVRYLHWQSDQRQLEIDAERGREQLAAGITR